MTASNEPSLRIIDSHTGGEPTRVVVAGGPALTPMPMAEARLVLQREFDRYRTALVGEPRSADIVVGAFLLPTTAPDCLSGVVFFNNVGYIGMCGHGTIGLVATLAYLRRIVPGTYRFDTPVGTVAATLHQDGSVTVANVASYRYRKRVPLEVPAVGTVHGDIAWGGNWFFLVEDHGCTLNRSELPELHRLSEAIRKALQAQGITGADGAEIDHIELVSPSPDGTADARNFVLCPGLEYDRSPCGTGTSAKLACLAADGKLAPGEIWRQESVIGSMFEGRYEPSADSTGNDRVLPFITGRAHVVADAQVVFDPADPFTWGIR